MGSHQVLHLNFTMQIYSYKYPKTYIRIRFQGKVATMPVVFTSCQYSIEYNPMEYGWECMKGFPEISGTVDYHVVGKTIWEEEDK